jgi:hypothetical protein
MQRSGATGVSFSNLALSVPFTSNIVGFVYDSDKDVYFAMEANGSVISFSEINPTTGVRTPVTVAGTVPAYASVGVRPYDRFWYSPIIKAALLVNAYNEPVYVLRRS